MLPPRDLSRESDDEQNSIVSLETMDTDNVSKGLLEQNWKALNVLNKRLRTPPNIEQ